MLLAAGEAPLPSSVVRRPSSVVAAIALLRRQHRPLMPIQQATDAITEHCGYRAIADAAAGGVTLHRAARIISAVGACSLDKFVCNL